MDARQAAKQLFDGGWLQKDIAKILKITERTISEWATSGNWKEQRIRREQVFATLKERVAHLNDYQLEVLERKVSLLREELKNDKLTVAELDKLLISRGDIDALQKMFVVFKDREFGFDKLVIVIRQFTEYIEASNQELAKDLLPYAMDFIENQRKEA